MIRRNLLIKVLILITAAFLGTAIFISTRTAGQKDILAGNAQPSSSVVTSAGQGASLSTGVSAGGVCSSGDETAGAQASFTQNFLQARIEQKYTSRLETIGSSYEGRLNSLVDAAISDYQLVKNQDPNADITPLANKYVAAGQALQAECDAKMYAIIEDFESELRANSLPVDAAAMARATYDDKISDKAAQILSVKP